MLQNRWMVTAIVSVAILLAVPLFSALDATPQPLSHASSATTMPYNGIFGILFSYIYKILQQRFNDNPNHPPGTPTAPTPSTDASDVTITPTLTWTGSDPDGDELSYTVQLAAQGEPRDTVYTGSATQATISLDYNTTYTWQVTATDNKASTTG
ncbi:MAG: hypothetical protein R6U10_07370, partial [Thermoplasmatota archaeon]